MNQPLMIEDIKEGLACCLKIKPFHGVSSNLQNVQVSVTVDLQDFQDGGIMYCVALCRRLPRWRHHVLCCSSKKTSKMEASCAVLLFEEDFQDGGIMYCVALCRRLPRWRHHVLCCSLKKTSKMEASCTVLLFKEDFQDGGIMYCVAL